MGALSTYGFPRLCDGKASCSFLPRWPLGPASPLRPLPGKVVQRPPLRGKGTVVVRLACFLLETQGPCYSSRIVERTGGSDASKKKEEKEDDGAKRSMLVR